MFTTEYVLKRCVQCEGEQIEPVRPIFPGVLVNGRSYRTPVQAQRCADCGETYFHEADIEASEEAAEAAYARGELETLPAPPAAAEAL